MADTRPEATPQALRNLVGLWLRTRAAHLDESYGFADHLVPKEKQPRMFQQLAADAEHSDLLYRLFSGERPLPFDKWKRSGTTPPALQREAPESVAGWMADRPGEAATCEFLLRGDYNDCAHAAGGRGAPLADWCKPCLTARLSEAERLAEYHRRTVIGVTKTAHARLSEYEQALRAARTYVKHHGSMLDAEVARDVLADIDAVLARAALSGSTRPDDASV